MNLEIKVEMGYLKVLNLKLYKISRWLQTHSPLTVQAQNFKDNRTLNIFSNLRNRSLKLFFSRRGEQPTHVERFVPMC